MCDQFQQFLKFQKQSVEPMSFCRSQNIGGISWNYLYKVDEVECNQNSDGSVQLDVKYYASKTKWIRQGLGFYRVPQQSHSVLTTEKNFDEHWTFVRPGEENRVWKSDGESSKAAVFHNCSNSGTKCVMFITTIK